MIRTPLIPVFLLACAQVLSAQTFYHTGRTEPVQTDHRPGLLLAGGATDNDDAMRWFLEQADGGDIVVLRASGSDGYNNYLHSRLGVRVNSVTSIVITSSAQANDNEVIRVLQHAEAVFIAGGNQWNYVNDWRGTRLLETLHSLIHDKGITIGGTSAGMAVLGEVVFTAENNSIWSSEALEDPFHWRMKLERDFLQVPFMGQTVTDTHYDRLSGDGMGRKGRHVAFLARMTSDWQMQARGIACNEYTAVAVDHRGLAMVFGNPAQDHFAYFLQADGGAPEVCVEGEPLTWDRGGRALKVYKVQGTRDGSNTFNLSGWTSGRGGQWEYWSVVNGELLEEVPTGVGRVDVRDASLRVFPNPAGPSLLVEWEGLRPASEAFIMDGSGRILQRQAPPEGPGWTAAFRVNAFAPGLYFVGVAGPDFRWIQPWVKK